MVDAFSFDQLVLFQPAPNFAESLLFQGAPADSTSTSLPAGRPEKHVRLLDGATFTLRPRVRQKKPLSFDDDDTFLDMDVLHERVRQRELFRENRKAIERHQTRTVHARPQIWAEKYRPQTFMLLCSAGHEKQYRLIMHWLRKWGHVVFGADIHDSEVDALGRPLRKILLVHGPLGIGKTAAVHLLARQMGYSVQELNAANSMDAMHGVESTDGAGRFANATAALKLKIKNALTTNSITANGKPTCLVIDEIDSAINAGDIVKVIGDLVAQDQANRPDDEKKKKKKFVLNRPIICIANDIYTHSVRFGPNPMEKLRPLCEIVAFKKPVTGAALGSRINVSAQKSVKEFLMDISVKENLGLDSKEIAEVFEVCDGDIRACINHLQFSSRKLDRELYSFVHSDALAATKDALVSWYSLVDRLFRRDQALSKDENFDLVMELMSTGDGKSAATGSLDKVVRGCFNRYLDVVHLQDDSVVRPLEMSDWLYYYDRMSLGTSDSFFYPTLAALKFWSLFSEIGLRRYQDAQSILPNARGLEFESLEQLKQNKATVRRLVDQIPLECRLACSGSSASNEFYVCQFVPFLAKLLSPDIGSAKVKSALKPHEKDQVEQLAALVKNFNIKMETQRDTVTNQTTLLFAPNWDEFTLFPQADERYEQKRKMLNARRMWLFPLLQTELDQAVMARLKRQRELTPAAERKTEGEVKQKRSRVMSSLDYFKSQYDEISTKIDTPKPMQHEATRIWVKHHEGFSNAVRKNIGWLELWTS